MESNQQSEQVEQIKQVLGYLRGSKEEALTSGVGETMGTFGDGSPGERGWSVGAREHKGFVRWKDQERA